MCPRFWKGWGNERDSLVFAPLVSWLLIYALAAVAVALVALALWRGLSGWWLRGLALAALLLTLANPAVQEEQRENLSDIVILIVDDSTSQSLGDRTAQTEAAVAAVQAELALIPNTELRIHRVADGAEDAGSLVLTALSEALAEEPRARVAGAILVTDGRVHDLGMLRPERARPAAGAADRAARPTGTAGVVVKNAPAFAIIGEEFNAGAQGRRCGPAARLGGRGRPHDHRRYRRAGDLFRPPERRPRTAGHPAAWRGERAAIRRRPGGRAR